MGACVAQKIRSAQHDKTKFRCNQRKECTLQKVTDNSQHNSIPKKSGDFMTNQIEKGQSINHQTMMQNILGLLNKEDDQKEVSISDILAKSKQLGKMKSETEQRDNKGREFVEPPKKKKPKKSPKSEKKE